MKIVIQVNLSLRADSCCVILARGALTGSPRTTSTSAAVTRVQPSFTCAEALGAKGRMARASIGIAAQLFRFMAASLRRSYPPWIIFITHLEH